MSDIVLVEAWRFPVKSCAGEQLHGQIEVTPMGIDGDRMFGVLDVDKQRLCSLKQPAYQPLAAVEARYRQNRLLLSHAALGDLLVDIRTGQATHESITVLDDKVGGVDQGDDAAEYFSRLLDKNCRLVGLPDGHSRSVDPDYRSDEHQTSYTDGYPLTLHTVASLDAVRKQLQVPANSDSMPSLNNRQVRSNLIINGEGFQEDHLRNIRIGSSALEIGKACTRCVMTELYVDDAGKVSRSPGTLGALRELGRYGFAGTNSTPKSIFAQNLLVAQPGVIAIGGDVTITHRSTDINWQSNQPTV